MDNFITSFVGLDVHKDSIAMAVAEAGRDEPRFLGTVSPQGNALHKALAKLDKPARLVVVYEAGPSGYGLWRDLQARGYRGEVIAPSKIARPPGDRVKTDRRDALMLARLAHSGGPVSVRVPDECYEAVRDLSRGALGCGASTAQSPSAAQRIGSITHLFPLSAVQRRNLQAPNEWAGCATMGRPLPKPPPDGLVDCPEL